MSAPTAGSLGPGRRHADVSPETKARTDAYALVTGELGRLLEAERMLYEGEVNVSFMRRRRAGYEAALVALVDAARREGAAGSWKLIGALRAILDGAFVCDGCGVAYSSDYEGPCQEPAPGATFDSSADGLGRWSRMCPGTVSAASTARRALREAEG